MEVELWANMSEAIMQMFTTDLWERRPNKFMLGEYRADFSALDSDPDGLDSPKTCSVYVFVPPRQRVIVRVTIDPMDTSTSCEDYVKTAAVVIIDEITTR